MALRVSRRKIATYAADQLLAGVSKKEVLRSVAAYLVENKRTREQILVVREIEDVLAALRKTGGKVVSVQPVKQSLEELFLE